MPTFDKSGKYRSAEGEEEMSPIEGAQITIPEAKLNNMSDFEEGDTVDLKIKARLGPTDESGRTFTVVKVDVEPMEHSASQYRKENRTSSPAIPAAVADDGGY